MELTLKSWSGKWCHMNTITELACWTTENGADHTWRTVYQDFSWSLPHDSCHHTEAPQPDFPKLQWWLLLQCTSGPVLEELPDWCGSPAKPASGELSRVGVSVTFITSSSGTNTLAIETEAPVTAVIPLRAVHTPCHLREGRGRQHHHHHQHHHLGLHPGWQRAGLTIYTRNTCYHRASGTAPSRQAQYIQTTGAVATSRQAWSVYQVSWLPLFAGGCNGLFTIPTICCGKKVIA